MQFWWILSIDLDRCYPNTDEHMLFEVNVEPGGRLNKKDGLTRYGDSHVKDKTS